jgi:hypothetical protein
MNIIAPIPTGIPVNPGAFNTESARRDNQLRETIPAPTESESSSAERGIGSEGERGRAAATQVPNLLVYERPQIQPQVLEANEALATSEESFPDNGQDQSAGREQAEARQQEQAEQQQIRELQSRDREVRAHEQAHATVGGRFAGAPSYEFETGPDGRQYAVGGEVSIDVSEEATPEESLQKFQQVEAAALAPAEPSPQDLRVAAEARQGASEARAEIAQQRAEELNGEGDSSLVSGRLNTITIGDQADNTNEASGPTRTQPNVSDDIPEIGEITTSSNAGASSRSLDISAQSVDVPFNPFEQTANTEPPQREERFNRFSQRIADFYQAATRPAELDNIIRQTA